LKIFNLKFKMLLVAAAPRYDITPGKLSSRHSARRFCSAGILPAWFAPPKRGKPALRSGHTLRNGNADCFQYKKKTFETKSRPKNKKGDGR
jgi:hypothetical protein